MNITVLLPAGRLPLEIMTKAHELAEKHGLEIYLSTSQNLRLLNVPEEKMEVIKTELAGVGANFKGPGKFPLPRVCVGKPHCNLGIIDTEELSRAILDRFSGKKITKQKFKIAISACPLSCSGPVTTDIGIVTTRAGFDVYAGGKGGPNPRAGRRILHNSSYGEMLAAVEKLVAFHDAHTKKKQRMYKLIDHPEFPYPQAG